MNKKPRKTAPGQWLLVPPAPGEKAWAELFAGLMQIAEYERSGCPDGSKPSPESLSLMAILSVIDYLKNCIPLCAARGDIPLLRIAQRIVDGEHGTRLSFMQPMGAANGGLSAETAEAHAVALAARALDRLVLIRNEHGKRAFTVATAAQEVCKAMKKGHAWRWQNVTPAIVMGWRRYCRERRAKQIAAAAIEKFHEPIFHQLPPREEAQMLLQVLCEAKLRGLGERPQKGE